MGSEVSPSFRCVASALLPVSIWALPAIPVCVLPSFLFHQFSLGLSSTRPLLGPGLLTLCAAYKLPEITFFTQVERAEHLHVQFRTQPFPPQRAYKVSKNSSGHFRFYKTETYLETYLGLK